MLIHLRNGLFLSFSENLVSHPVDLQAQAVPPLHCGWAGAHSTGPGHALGLDTTALLAWVVGGRLRHLWALGFAWQALWARLLMEDVDMSLRHAGAFTCFSFQESPSLPHKNAHNPSRSREIPRDPARSRELKLLLERVSVAAGSKGQLCFHWSLMSWTGLHRKQHRR